MIDRRQFLVIFFKLNYAFIMKRKIKRYKYILLFVVTFNLLHIIFRFLVISNNFLSI